MHLRPVPTFSKNFAASCQSIQPACRYPRSMSLTTSNMILHQDGVLSQFENLVHTLGHIRQVFPTATVHLGRAPARIPNFVERLLYGRPIDVAVANLAFKAVFRAPILAIEFHDALSK